MSENSLLAKIEGLYDKFNSLQEQLSDPDVMGDMKKFVQLNNQPIPEGTPLLRRLIIRYDFYWKLFVAFIPAAGFGTRFLPETKAVPKEMMPIVDTPALQLIVEEVVDSGIDNVLIITSGKKRCMEDHFDKCAELENLLKKAGKTAELQMCERIENMANFSFIRQKEMKGSGHAIGLAKEFVGNEPFAVLYADDLIYSPENPVTAQLIKAYETTGTSILGVQTVDKKEVYKYTKSSLWKKEEI